MEIMGFVMVAVTNLVMGWLAKEASGAADTRVGSSYARSVRACAKSDLQIIAAALELRIGPIGGRARTASNEHVRIEHRVDGGLASRVYLARRGPAWPSFALLPCGEPLFAPPPEVRERVHALRSRAWSPPFAGWAPPATEAWAELRREARRAAAEVELLEHHEGRIEAWIVSVSAEQTIVKIRRLMRFAAAARPAETGPYR